MKKLQVIVVFEFDIEDPNGSEADFVVDNLTEDCDHLREEYGAGAVFVDDVITVDG